MRPLARHRHDPSRFIQSFVGLVAQLKLLIAKLKREQFGSSSDRQRPLLDQIELQFNEFETDANKDSPGPT
jgi:hypothetical protein